jgi:hypothetical protein
VQRNLETSIPAAGSNIYLLTIKNKRLIWDVEIVEPELQTAAKAMAAAALTVATG